MPWVDENFTFPEAIQWESIPDYDNPFHKKRDTDEISWKRLSEHDYFATSPNILQKTTVSERISLWGDDALAMPEDSI